MSNAAAVGAENGVNMVPDQIRRQAAEVAKFDEALKARDAAQTEPATDGDTDPGETETDEQASQEPVSEAKPAQPAPERTDDEEKWRSRYDSLRGKYDAEVAPLHRQNRELQQKLTEMEQRLEQLSKPAPEPEPKPANSLVTPHDVENFGGDLIDLIKRQSTEVFNQSSSAVVAKIKELEAENARLRESVTSVEQKQGQSQQQTFLQQLTDKVPDWQKLNTDTRFLNWLAAEDPLSGLIRHALLDAAADAYDAKRAAALFNAFKQEFGIVAPTPTPTPAARTTPPKPQRNPEVSAQVTPGRSKASSPHPPADPNQKIWKMSDIEQFYRDCTPGRNRYSPEDQARINAEIDSAVAEGRVR